MRVLQVVQLLVSLVFLLRTDCAEYSSTATTTRITPTVANFVTTNSPPNFKDFIATTIVSPFTGSIIIRSTPSSVTTGEDTSKNDTLRGRSFKPDLGPQLEKTSESSGSIADQTTEKLTKKTLTTTVPQSEVSSESIEIQPQEQTAIALNNTSKSNDVISIGIQVGSVEIQLDFNENQQHEQSTKRSMTTATTATVPENNSTSGNLTEKPPQTTTSKTTVTPDPHLGSIRTSTSTSVSNRTSTSTSVSNRTQEPSTTKSLTNMTTTPQPGENVNVNVGETSELKSLPTEQTTKPTTATTATTPKTIPTTKQDSKSSTKNPGIPQNTIPIKVNPSNTSGAKNKSPIKPKVLINNRKRKLTAEELGADKQRRQLKKSARYRELLARLKDKRERRLI